MLANLLSEHCDCITVQRYASRRSILGDIDPGSLALQVHPRPFQVQNLPSIDVPARAYVDAMLGVYELNRIELLRDVFVWAYERSCQQYVAVRSQLVPPDTFRLRYRAALTETVRAIVQEDRPLTIEAIRQSVPASVASGDREDFAKLVQEEFKTMHAGNIVRFGLRPLEFENWKLRNTI